MTTLAQDTFAGRTNSGTWNTASDGTTWSTLSGFPTLNVTAGEGKIKTAQFSNAMMRLSTLTATDQEAVVRFQLGGAGDEVGIVLRCDNAGQNLYRFIFDNGDSVILFDKLVAGSRIFIGNSTHITAIPAMTYYWMRFQCIGSTLNARYWQDGSIEPSTWNMTNTDSDITSGGFGIFASCTDTTSSLFFDHFTADDTHVPPPPVTPLSTVIGTTRDGKVRATTLSGQIRATTRDGIVIGRSH